MPQDKGLFGKIMSKGAFGKKIAGDIHLPAETAEGKRKEAELAKQEAAKRPSLAGLRSVTTKLKADTEEMKRRNAGRK